MDSKRIQYLTIGLIREKIIEKYNNKYTLMTKVYSGNSKDKAVIKCNDCGSLIEIKYDALLYWNTKKICKTCERKEKAEIFKNKIKTICNDEYIVLTEYTNCKKKVTLLHNIPECMNEFQITPDSFLNKGSRCPKCAIKIRADKLFISQIEFENRINNIFNDEVLVLGTYTGNKNKIKIQHIPCGRILNPLAGDLLQGKVCSYCKGVIKKTTESFKEELYQKYGNEYDVLSEYINAKQKVKIKHNYCGYVWDINPYSILKARRCPKCNKSSGEKLVENFLLYNNLNYKTQIKFKDCKNISYLKYDFAILDKNNNIKILIEYDGTTHYIPSRFGGVSTEEAELNLKEQLKKDFIKDIYCKRNGIPLLRINYLDNVCNKLQNYLKLFSIKTSIPTENLIGNEKSKVNEFIEELKTLPNGIYEKSYFIKKYNLNNRSLSHFMKDEFIQNYIKENNIKVHFWYIEILTNGNYRYDDYINFGINNNFDFEVYNNIKLFYNLPPGKYYKRDTTYKNKATAKSKSYEFYNRFLTDNKINLGGYFIKKEVA